VGGPPAGGILRLKRNSGTASYPMSPANPRLAATVRAVVLEVDQAKTSFWGGIGGQVSQKIPVGRIVRFVPVLGVGKRQWAE